MFARDGYTCQACEKKGIRVEAHHIKEQSNYPELRFDVNNGITLCRDCHKKTDNYGSKAKLKNIVPDGTPIDYKEWKKQ